MDSIKRHLGRLTEDSIRKMLRSPGQLFVSGLICFDCGSPHVIGTLNLDDYPVATGHTIAHLTGATTIPIALRARPIRSIHDLRNRTQL